MTAPGRSLGDVVAALDAEGRLAATQRERAQNMLAELRVTAPWYVRVMVGFGAWIASLLLVSFVAGFGGFLSGGQLVVGIAMIVGALLLRREKDGDFWVQATLAVSLAGQALVSWGFVELADWQSAEPLCVLVIAMSAALFVLFPDRIHRVLMVVIGGFALVSLVYLLELTAIVPLLGPAFAAGLVVLALSGPELYGRGRGRLLRPLAVGLMLNAFGCLLLSAVYVLPELGGDIVIYPRPWLSTLALGPLFLYAGRDAWPAVAAARGRAGPAAFGGLLLGVIVVCWLMPGLLLALTVVLLGGSTANRTMAAAGMAFAVVFTAVFFYGIEVSLLAKSVVLASGGAVLLLVRAALGGGAGRGDGSRVHG